MSLFVVVFFVVLLLSVSCALPPESRVFLYASQR